MIMTKEEAIDAIIERYKGYENKNRIDMYNCCSEIIDCDYCPLRIADGSCSANVAMSLLDRLVKTEEHQETNFDHYIKNYLLVAYDDEVTFKLKDGWKKSFCEVDFKKWLASPYEKPKPKYKLSKFEYDLLRVHLEEVLPGRIRDYWELKGMCGKGYFKDIPTDVPISDILDNCEVTHDEA